VRRDNLNTPDGLSVRLFLTQYYRDIVESADNIIRGNTRFSRDQREELARDLAAMLAEHLLKMQDAPVNLGAYSHRWMKQQVVWQRTAFEKLSRVNTHDFDHAIPQGEDEPIDCSVLDEYLPFANLDPFEKALFEKMREGISAEDIAEDLRVPKGTVHHYLGAIRRKFADARLCELLEGGYIELDRLTDELRKAWLRRYGTTDDNTVERLPDDTLGDERADEQAA
jgi:hypothetical protein